MDNSIYFDSAGLYIASQSSINAKITAIDAIIDALLITAADSAANAGISEYSLNDGQTIIRTTYRGPDAIYTSIQSFQKLKIWYQNQSMGRVVRLVDSKNFNNNRRTR